MIAFFGKYRNHFSIIYSTPLKNLPDKYDKYIEFIGFIFQPIINVLWNSWYTNLNRLSFIKCSYQDTWAGYNTMAQLILPIIKKSLKEKHGIPFVEDEDVPENIRSSNSKEEKKSNYEIDEFYDKRWDYVTNEIIFALENTIDESWEEQFYHGNLDVEFVPCEDEKYLEMVETEKNTFWFDKKGYLEYNNRIVNGRMLLGKYWGNFWV